MNNNQKATKYILYARKSTESDDKQAASIDSQLNEMIPIAKQRGLNIVETITESVSGYKKGRTGFKKLADKIETGEVDGIICWSLSRLARNAVDAGAIIDYLQNNKIKHIVTYKKDYDPDETTMMLYVEFGINNQYSKDLSVDTLRGLRQKAGRGWSPQATLPLGYMHNPIEKLRKYSNEEIVKDPKTFNLLQQMFKNILYKNYTTGEAIKEVILLGLTNRKGNAPTRSAMYRILNNPFYCGEFDYPKDGEKYEGKHPKMLTKKEFLQVQRILHQKFPLKCKKHEHKYNNLLKCTKCGCAITADPPRAKYIKSKKYTRWYRYYHCTQKRGNCGGKYIKEKGLEQLIKGDLKRFFLPPEIIDLLKEEIEKEKTLTLQNPQNSTILLEKRIQVLEGKKSRLLDLLIEGQIKEKDYNDKRKEIEKDIEKLQIIVSEKEEEAETKELPSAVQLEEYDHLNNEARKTFLKEIYEGMYYYDGEFEAKPFPLVKIFYNPPAEIKKEYEQARTDNFVMNKQFIQRQIRENVVWGG